MILTEVLAMIALGTTIACTIIWMGTAYICLKATKSLNERINCHEAILFEYDKLFKSLKNTVSTHQNQIDNLTTKVVSLLNKQQ